MERFINHILYGLHLFTRNFDPVVYHNGKYSYNGLMANDVFIFMLMTYLFCVGYTIIRVFCGHDTKLLFKDKTFFTVFSVIILLITWLVFYYCFMKDNKQEKYYWEFASKPDSAHTEWKLLSWGLFFFSFIYVILCANWR